MKKVLIHGNSGGGLDKKRGKYIDENFDIIVRLNNCIVDGYSEYVGSRTDYIYFSNKWIKFRKKYPNSKILMGNHIISRNNVTDSNVIGIDIYIRTLLQNTEINGLLEYM